MLSRIAESLFWIGRYIERSADALYSIMARSGNVSASMENLLSQSVAQMQQSPEPSVFITPIENLPPDCLVKAMRSPRGDQTGVE